MTTRHGVSSALSLLRHLPPPPAAYRRSFSASQQLKEHGPEGIGPPPNEADYDYRKPSYAARRNCITSLPIGATVSIKY